MFSYENFNKKMPEKQDLFLFGKNIDEKTQYKNLYEHNQNRAEKSRKKTYGKSNEGKTLKTTDRKKDENTHL